MCCVVTLLGHRTDRVIWLTCCSSDRLVSKRNPRLRMTGDEESVVLLKFNGKFGMDFVMVLGPIMIISVLSQLSLRKLCSSHVLMSVRQRVSSLCSPIGLNVTFVYINNSMKWVDALSFCREHHTDLASVRNMEENQKIMELTPAGKKPWIGLFRDTWKWTDGSNSSFRNWKGGEPNNYQNQNENCAVADFESSGQWDDRNCDEKRAFICYRGHC
uniref:C-type lectin domain-containing protein n=1 Tax=Oryzias latipes TaxID=8090 RepID=A0A3P9K6V7_ORYLA